MNFTPFPKLVTPRLVLRQLRDSDAHELFFLRSDPEVMKYVDRPRAQTMEEVHVFIANINKLAAENTSVLWAITLKDEDVCIGTICFWNIEFENSRAEIGYTLHTSYQGKGIMYEAGRAAMEYGFGKMALHSVVANVNPLNEASIRLLQKLGFKREAYFRENYYFGGKYLDTAVYCLLETDAQLL